MADYDSHDNIQVMVDDGLMEVEIRYFEANGWRCHVTFVTHKQIYLLQVSNKLHDTPSPLLHRKETLIDIQSGAWRRNTEGDEGRVAEGVL